MGQRHQIFIRTFNPANLAEGAEKRELQKEFGRGKTTILAFHNQWLYGRSALANALNVLNFVSQFTTEEKTSTESWSGYDNPFSPNHYKFRNNSFKPDGIKEIEFIMNFRAVNTEWLTAGMGGGFYIGETDEGIREDFTMGDNNDGITIIDAINNKYCFMNIYEQSTADDLSHDVRDLPQLVPCDARKYVATYYGETLATANPYHLKDKSKRDATGEYPFYPKEKQEKIIQRHIKENAKLAKKFDKFGLLTMKEIYTMFPKMKLRLSVPVSKVFSSPDVIISGDVKVIHVNL